MKIADPENIKAGERELLETIRENVDLGVIEEFISRQLKMSELEFSDGDIVIHKGQVAYRLDFKAVFGASVLFDRNGNFISDMPVQEEQYSQPEELPGDIAEVDTEVGSSDVVGDSSVSEMDSILKKNRDYWQSRVGEA